MRFNKKILIGDIEISENSPAFIIAEAGVNHNGDTSLAKRLIDIAASSGANAVKFQAFKTEHLVLEHARKAPYQLRATSAVESQADMLRKLELSQTQIVELQQRCKKREILFLITPFDEFSLKALDPLALPAYKISSTDCTNPFFLKRVAERKKPIILSTGMSYLHEIEAALKAIHPIHRDVILLQCTSNYPISDEEANLNVIKTYKEQFGLLVGYSDHSEGIGAAPYAVAMGAKLIEKHFTIDKTLPGPDHEASLTPSQLKKLVQEIRKVERYLGSPLKTPTKSELETRKFAQKYLVSLKDVKKGEILNEENITAKRTGGEGISAIHYAKFIGKRTKKSFKKNEILREEGLI